MKESLAKLQSLDLLWTLAPFEALTYFEAEPSSIFFKFSEKIFCHINHLHMIEIRKLKNMLLSSKKFRGSVYVMIGYENVRSMHTIFYSWRLHKTCKTYQRIEKWKWKIHGYYFFFYINTYGAENPYHNHRFIFEKYTESCN